MEEIGRVKRLRRYPVKSMMGEDLEEAKIEPSGFTGDRIYAFVDDDSKDKEFPWMTARQAHEMLLFKPRFVSSATDVAVESPDGKTRFSIRDKEFERYLEERFGYQMTLRYDPSGCFDSKPISLIGLQTVKQLELETTRCAIPTLDPVTSSASPLILETIQKKHAGCAGVYAVVEQSGNVRIDDSISLL